MPLCSSGGTGISVDGLVAASSWGHVGVCSQVDVDIIMSSSVGADEPGVQLLPGHSRRTPLDGISAPHKRAKGVLRSSPCNFEFGRTSGKGFDLGIETRSLWVLDELTTGDLELGGGGWGSENGI